MKSHLKYLLLSGFLFFICFVVVPVIFFFDINPWIDFDPQNVTDIEKADSDVDFRKSQCPNYYFPCGESLDELGKPICIRRNLHCDQKEDCPKGDDEKGCDYMLSDVRKMYINNSINENGTRDWSTLEKKFEKFYGNCSLLDLIFGNCQCDMDHELKADCKGRNFTAIPSFFRKSITSMNLENNQITSIDSQVINSYPKLAVVSLRYNLITRLEDFAFSELANLTRLYLRSNLIKTVGRDAFYGLHSLQKLYINDNQIQVLSLDSFSRTPSLTLLDLANNQIRFNRTDSFPSLPIMDWIDLSHNQLTIIPTNLLHNVPQLTKLHLSGGGIYTVEPDAFKSCPILHEIDLSWNYFDQLPDGLFHGLGELSNLQLSDNHRVWRLPELLFSDLISLKSLNLTGVQISNINLHFFQSNPNLTHLSFSRFKYCLFAPQVRLCHPSSDGVSSLQHLLVYPILRVSVWIVAVITCLGNFTVITWRSVSTNEDPVLSLFVKNLSLADLLMGIYLISIGVNDIGFEDQYLSRAVEWMGSARCSCIGFLSMVSSEFSVLILMIVAIERYRSIAFNSRLLTVKSARILIALAWFVSLSLAGLPLVLYTNYYGSNGLCFPLHLDDPYGNGWEFSAIVFLGVNLLAVMSMLLLYTKMFLILHSDRKTSIPGAVDVRKEDTILAIRFFFIVFTDCMCWLPIVMMKTLAFTSTGISPVMYSWIVVFILPINSALNPVIYTLAAPTQLRQIVTRKIVWMWDAVCPKVESFSQFKRRSSADRKGSGSTLNSHFQGELDRTRTDACGKRVSNASSNMSVLTLSTMRQLSIASSEAESRRSSSHKGGNQRTFSLTTDFNPFNEEEDETDETKLKHSLTHHVPTPISSTDIMSDL